MLVGRGYDDLLKGNALDLRTETRDFKNIVAVRKRDRKAIVRKCLIIGLATLCIAFLSLCIGYNGAGTSSVRFYSPIEVITVLKTAIEVTVADVFSLPSSLYKAQIINAVPMYHEVLLRAAVTITTCFCGAMLAVSGMLFQNTFKNPIASPSLLGVSNGVQLGLLVLIAQFGLSAKSMITERFIYCYVGGIIVLLLVLGLGRLIGGKDGFNVFNLLVVGTIISQLVGVIMSYASQIMMGDNSWEVFYELQESLQAYTGIGTYVFLIVITIACFIPVFILRFRFNLLSFSNTEVKMSGVNDGALKVTALVCGSLMILTAQIYIGSIAVFALVIPFLSRYIFGVEFRKQLCGNIFLGMLILLFCRDISAVVPFVGTGVPIGTIASIIALPIFVWMMTLNKKTWE